MKTINMLNNNLNIHRFTVSHKYKLIGSNEKRGLLYTNDYDILDKNERPIALANHLKKIDFKGIYFMDFKAGIDPLADDKKLRWTENELHAGFKIVNGEKKILEQALQEKMMVKLDLIIPIADRFAEVNIIYRFHKKESKQEIIESLQEDIKKYSSINSMKALKRLYSILLLEKKNKKKISQLEIFFNSQAGLLNKVCNDLELLKLLTETYHISHIMINHNLQMLKENLALSTLVSKKIILEFNNPKNIPKIIKYLRTIINHLAKSILKEIK